MSLPEINIVCKHFNELSTTELYAIMQLRIQVFSVEQNCPYQDADGKDQQSWHLMIYNKATELVAYSRLLPKGVSYSDYASIGRVVNAQSVRGQGIGILLMQKSIEKCMELFKGEPIKISAQAYLRKFYTSLGFVATGEEYIEDHIPHIAMLRIN